MSLTKVTLETSSDSHFLDLPVFRKKYQKSETPAMRFYVEGIRCGKCVQKIESLQNQLSDIQILRVNMSNQQLYLQMKSEKTSFSLVVTAIEKLGFRLRPIENSEELNNFVKSEDRSDIRRLAAAAICASNIMMFSFAVYLGADSSLELFFKWLSFSLYLPVVTYVAWPFYKGFWNSLMQRSLSIDGPMAIASSFGFLFSTINLWRGVGSIYFDSLSGFLFLILLSRFAQKRMQRTFLSAGTAAPLDILGRARKLAGDNFIWTPSEILNPGDKIQAITGEVIPVDGVLLSARADFDSSYLTGESHSIVKHRGMPVEAGAVLLSAEAVIDVKAVGLQTEFGKLIRKVQENSTQKTELQNLSDRWSQILLISVYGLAVVYLALNWRISPEVSVERALALIILACPCAMAFGTPLALSFSMRNAFRKGFLFKSGDVFEKIQKVKNIFFDKTGTLTGRNMTVVATRPEQISAELEQIVLSLEAISKHPIAEALRIYFAKGTLQTLDITNAMEVPGSGLLGEYKGRHFCMRSSEQITGRKSVALYENAEPLVHFFLQDSLLVPSRQLVTELVNKGYKVSVLSGDSENEVKKIADALEIPASQCFARMTAQKKSEKVAAVPNSLMIGDGANDSLAFQNADVGIAVAGSVELALKSADIYLLSADLSKIAELFDISRRALFLIRQNLAISLVYNSFGAAAALMGYINPFVAALLMPVSSGFILLSSWWGSRD